MKIATARKIILGAIAAILAAVVLSNINFGSIGSSDSGRSVENYCKTWLNYTQPKSEAYDATVDAYKKAMANSGTSDKDKAERTKAIEDVTTMFAGMPGDLAELYNTVEKVAPSDIEPDVARAAQDAHAYEEQQRTIPESLRSFGAGFFGQIMQAMVAAPTQKRIHDWNAAHCDLQGQNNYFN